MKIKEIYVPIFTYLITYIKVENFSDVETKKVTLALKKCKIDDENIDEFIEKMKIKYTGGASTFSNKNFCELVVLIYPQNSKERELETIMHEKRHCEDLILEQLGIEDMETAAYLSGWLAVEFSNLK